MVVGWALNLGIASKYSLGNNAHLTIWDTHDFTDFDTDAPDATVKAVCAVPIEVELFDALSHQAQQLGVGSFRGPRQSLVATKTY